MAERLNICLNICDPLPADGFLALDQCRYCCRSLACRKEELGEEFEAEVAPMLHRRGDPCGISRLALSREVKHLTRWAAALRLGDAGDIAGLLQPGQQRIEVGLFEMPHQPQRLSAEQLLVHLIGVHGMLHQQPQQRVIDACRQWFSRHNNTHQLSTQNVSKCWQCTHAGWRLSRVGQERMCDNETALTAGAVMWF